MWVSNSNSPETFFRPNKTETQEKKNTIWASDLISDFKNSMLIFKSKEK